MVAFHPYTDKKVALLGLGITGQSLISHLKKFGIDPICWDDEETQREKFKAKGIEIFDPNNPKIWKELDILVISPGIPFLYPEPHSVIKLARENAVQIATDIDLFFDCLEAKSNFEGTARPKVICVTGSNGKSTTTALIHHMLTGMSKDNEMGGNIGRPVMDLNMENPQCIKVIELSSYQLEIATKLQLDIGIFLNLSRDHLTRHGGLGGYFSSKSKLFHQGKPQYSIIGVDQNEGKSLANSLEVNNSFKTSVIQISSMGPVVGSNWAVFISKNFMIEVKSGKEIFRADLAKVLKIPGEHNQQNACAAYAACRALGLNPGQSFRKIGGFEGLPHRTALVRSLDKIIFVNDSKATNLESAKKSLRTFKNIRWIAGGLKKEGDIIDFSTYRSRIKKVYLIGSSSKEFSSSLKGIECEICGELAIAVSNAYRDSNPGDTVLLAPGCASFDQFKNFEERGEEFCKIVNELE